MVYIVHRIDHLFAQKYQPKYLREDNKNFKNLTTRTDNDGWIEFKRKEFGLRLRAQYLRIVPQSNGKKSSNRSVPLSEWRPQKNNSEEVFDY